MRQAINSFRKCDKFVHGCSFIDSLELLINEIHIDTPCMNLATVAGIFISLSCTCANFIFKVILK